MASSSGCPTGWGVQLSACRLCGEVDEVYSNAICFGARAVFCNSRVLSCRPKDVEEQMNVRVLGNLARWSERRRPRAPLERRARVVGVDEDPKLRLARVSGFERLGPAVRRRADEARGLK